MFIQVNPNPLQKSTGDCVIRAISILMDKTWDEIYLLLSVYGFEMKEWGNSNALWDAFLRDEGYVRNVIPDTCPICYTVADFCRDNPDGKFLLATGEHVLCVISGDHYDTWNSAMEHPIFYYAYKN